MCKIKSGKQLTSAQDMQNLVIGILLRQQYKYNKAQIYNCVNNYCINAEYKMSQNTIRKLVDKNLDFLSRIGTVQCKDGQYIPLNPYDYIIGV